MPIKLEKSYIPQKNTLLSIVWKNFWNCKNFCHGRLQTSFSKSNAFSVKGACPPPGWCHAHFFHEWSSPLLVLSIDVSFVLKFFWKGDKNFENWKSGPIYIEDPVYPWHFLYASDLKVKSDCAFFTKQFPVDTFHYLSYCQKVEILIMSIKIDFGFFKHNSNEN